VGQRIGLFLSIDNLATVRPVVERRVICEVSELRHEKMQYLHINLL